MDNNEKRVKRIIIFEEYGIFWIKNGKIIIILIGVNQKNLKSLNIEEQTENFSGDFGS